ncbi:acetyl-CoA hydrolase/transferase C-terminal domain-containing protein [Haliea atlantica]
MDQPCAESEAIAEQVVQRVGPHIVLALPLGLGKANHIANALYDRVAADPALSLTILTALTLEKPAYQNNLERRFLQPVVERLFGDYPALRYAEARRQGRLPDNIRVEEFFFLAGSRLGDADAQQNHICANYTHVPEYLLDRGINVIAQLVAAPPTDSAPQAYSASCNTDLTGELLQARRAGRADFLFLGQVNRELPFMAGDALLAAEEFDAILDSPACEFPLFAPPRQPLGLSDQAAALQVARLVPDGGTLQIGIGALGDAIAQALILRHRDNRRFRSLSRELAGEPAAPADHLAPFASGLHGLSEMLVDGFLDLYEAGVLRREVDGKVLNAAFFLGSRSLYQRLREMDDRERERLAMRSILFTNQLYGDQAARQAARTGARFINKAMLVTLRGEVVSDGLEDGRVVSGVGGQFDFAAQAFALPDARSVIVVPATRRQGGKVESNIHWQYGNTTIPRHYRDIVVTEYGIADLRGKTDAQVIEAMLSVTDARFQAPLLAQAQAAGKLPWNFRPPATWQRNTPERIRAVLQPAIEAGTLHDLPFASDFSPTEQALLRALDVLKGVAHSRWQLARLAWGGLLAPAATPGLTEALARMELQSPRGVRERLEQALLKGAWVRRG